MELKWWGIIIQLSAYTIMTIAGLFVIITGILAIKKSYFNKKIMKGGYDATFPCPSCGAVTKIHNTTKNFIHVCSECGATIQGKVEEK